MAKEYSSDLQGVMGILKEVLKLSNKNKKIFLYITLFTLIPYSLLLIAYMYSFVSIFSDLSMKIFPLLSMDPKSPEYLKLLFKIKEESIFLIFVVLIFLLLIAIVSLFSMVAIIYVSAMSYLGKDLTLKDLYLRLKNIWKRPVITWLYVSLLIAGYMLLILPIYIPAVLGSGSIIIYSIGIFPIIIAVCLNLYLALIWMLSLVISVSEDCYGLQALGKAEELIKGRKVLGLVLTFAFMVLYTPIVFVSMINRNHQTVMIQCLKVYVSMMLMLLVNIVSMMVYTVYYFECKKNHGEVVEVEEDMGYSKVPTIPLVSEDLL